MGPKSSSPKIPLVIAHFLVLLRFLFLEAIPIDWDDPLLRDFKSIFFLPTPSTVSFLTSSGQLCYSSPSLRSAHVSFSARSPSCSLRLFPPRASTLTRPSGLQRHIAMPPKSASKAKQGGISKTGAKASAAGKGRPRASDVQRELRYQFSISDALARCNRSCHD